MSNSPNLAERNSSSSMPSHSIARSANPTASSSHEEPILAPDNEKFIIGK